MSEFAVEYRITQPTIFWVLIAGVIGFVGGYVAGGGFTMAATARARYTPRWAR